MEHPVAQQTEAQRVAALANAIDRESVLQRIQLRAQLGKGVVVYQHCFIADFLWLRELGFQVIQLRDLVWGGNSYVYSVQISW
jgi:hypothetical protein